MDELTIFIEIRQILYSLGILLCFLLSALLACSSRAGR